ncbi:MAG: PQQ-binding-like beta-propeller repeat protein [Bacteroidota bacterium]|nr:PQQ-binding-like beta-propeller repeat protein [Bacteroidota bacterium]
MIKAVCLVLTLSGFLFCSCSRTASKVHDYSGWTAYAGSKDGIRYSSDTTINPSNVTQLKVAWSYSSGDKDSGNRTQDQCNPIMIDGILYGVTPTLKLFALNAATGQQKWLFDPALEDSSAKSDPFAFFKVTRGVMYWQDDAGKDKRIIYSAGSKTFAINADNGRPVRSFGNNGFIDLTQNLDRDTGTFNSYVVGTTPGVIYKNVLIMGTRVAESADAAPGHVRAYDVMTGKLKWIFHTIPHPGERGYETWPDKDAWKKLGGANDWAGMSLDEDRGIVYIPTGSVGGDFYGGFRKGQNLYANSLIALDAETGTYIWHYQFVHHDLWDRDLPANPNLVTITVNGNKIDAVAQITKQGYVFLFDRTNGQPVFPIVERTVPPSDLPGEEAWPTQPFPALPEPFARETFTADDVTDRTPEAHAEMLEKYNKVKYHDQFIPPGKEGVFIFPGFDGGGEWGGSAVDPESGILYVNSSEMPWALFMIDAATGKPNTIQSAGQQVYSKYCITCHGPELKGNGTSFPSLVDIDKKYNAQQIWNVISHGRNMMPAFKQIQQEEKNELLAFLLKLKDPVPTAKVKSNLKEQVSKNGEAGGKGMAKEPVSNATTGVAKNNIMDEVKYNMTGYNRFLDKEGYPGIKPPWGTLNAVNLNTGKLLWKVPLGNDTSVQKPGEPQTGTEGYGGPLVTKGGLVFIANSKDAKMHAYDKKTGKLLWEEQLPVPGYATPATYSIRGKQYVVIACGGGKIGSKSGDQYVAFAFP